MYQNKVILVGFLGSDAEDRRRTICPCSRSAKPAKSATQAELVVPRLRTTMRPLWARPNVLEGKRRGGLELLCGACGKAILALNLTRKESNGAAHRKNCDTPPLAGCC